MRSGSASQKHYRLGNVLLLVVNRNVLLNELLLLANKSVLLNELLLLVVIKYTMHCYVSGIVAAVLTNMAGESMKHLLAVFTVATVKHAAPSVG